MMPYWQVWGAAMIAGYLTISFILFVMIVTGQTMYARKAALLSPFSFMILSTILIAVLPQEFTGVKNFFSVTGLNLPLLIFYIVTLMTLSGRPSITSELS
jgi:phosphatidylglycerophosphate synthase